MKTINLLQTVKEVDGVTPYAFGTSTQQKDGKPVQVILTKTFKDLVYAKVNRIHSEKEEDKTVVYNLAEKLSKCTESTTYDDTEISVLTKLIDTEVDVIAVQFKKLITA